MTEYEKRLNFLLEECLKELETIDIRPYGKIPVSYTHLRYVVVFYRKNNLPYTRKAFLASKKVGNSVRRNRARCV